MRSVLVFCGTLGVLLSGCGHARSRLFVAPNDAPCASNSKDCICGQVVSSSEGLLNGARVVAYGERYWVSERKKPLPANSNSLSDDDIRPGDIGGVRAATDRLGRFCLELPPDDRYLIVVLHSGQRPAASIIERGTHFAVAVLASGPEFRWGL